MARNVVMSELVLRCQRRCDREKDKSIVPAEWKAMISTQVGDLYREVAHSGFRYFESTFPIVANGAATYSLPTDHFETIKIDRVLDAAGTRRELDELMVQESNRWAGQTGDATHFAVVGQNIVLYPKPASGSYEMWYVPQPPDLSNATDGLNVDTVTPDGEEFIVWGVAVKAHAKGETDPTLAMQEREQARKHLIEWAVTRALNQPRRRVVRGNEFDCWGDEYGLPGGWWQR